MKRWQEDLPLMLRRWDEEKRKHCEIGDVGGECHCFRGPGFMRKRRPYGCTRPRCMLCHAEKLYPQARGAKKRAAIDFELVATAEDYASWTS
jgi:hypothetical protein